MTEIVVGERRRPFFTAASLARYLGVSVRTVRQMLADGKLPSYMFEGARRIAAEDVDAYIRAHRAERAGRP